MRANGNNKWVDLLPGFLKHHNAQKVTGTEVVRNTVNQFNYVGLLSQLFKSSAPTLMSNISGSENLPDELASLVWKYDIGAKVLLARRVDYSLKSRKNTFDKVSVIGSFGPEVHVVSRRMGKNNANLFITPVYELEKLPGTWFYEQEVRLADFARDKASDKTKQIKLRTLIRLKRSRVQMKKPTRLRKKSKRE